MFNTTTTRLYATEGTPHFTQKICIHTGPRTMVKKKSKAMKKSKIQNLHCDTHTQILHTYIHVDLLGHTSKNINKRPTNKQNHKIVHMYVYETHIDIYAYAHTLI